MKLQEFTGKLFEIETTAHIAHLQTKSFAQHIALKEGYLKQIIDDINELLYSTIYKLTNLA